VKVRPNALPKGVPEEKTLEQIGKSLRELGEFATATGRRSGWRSTARAPRTSRASRPSWMSRPTKTSASAGTRIKPIWRARDLTTIRSGEGEDPLGAPARFVPGGISVPETASAVEHGRFTGFCLAEIPASADPVRVMKYFPRPVAGVSEFAVARRHPGPLRPQASRHSRTARASLVASNGFSRKLMPPSGSDPCRRPPRYNRWYRSL